MMTEQPKINITDIVVMNDNDEVLYMVVDIIDFSTELTSGKKIVDIDFELMQIYPIMQNAKYTTVGREDIFLKEKNGTKNYKLVLQLIQKDREKRGWYGMPDFVEIATTNLRMSNAQATPQTKVEPPQPKLRRLDVVKYDKFQTIDEGLKMLSDLLVLQDMFGKDQYLDEIAKVKVRLMVLNK